MIKAALLPFLWTVALLQVRAGATTYPAAAAELRADGSNLSSHFDEKQIKHWTRQGPLNQELPRTSEDLPLSDPQNRGHWVKFEPMWDEFQGTALDTNKWNVGMS